MASVIPHPANNVDVDELVRHYFSLDFTVSDICGFLLFIHHVAVSTRTIKRILKKKLGFKRRGLESPIEDIVRNILELQRQGYSNLGHKAMWKLLNTQYRLRVTQETTRVVLKCIDPAVVALRSRHCLQRRKYGSQGPSFIIHVDGYDKLKPFGIAIHGAIDGFSRRIL